WAWRSAARARSSTWRRGSPRSRRPSARPGAPSADPASRVSVVPGEPGPVGIALLEERVAPLLGLLGHVGEARGLAGEDLLAHHAVVDRVERELEHALRRRALAADLPRPLERDLLEVLVGDD